MGTIGQIGEVAVSGDIHSGFELHHPGHRLQFYGSDTNALIQNAGEFLREGLSRGEAALIVATKEHSEAFECRLSGRGTALFIDARELLDSLMESGRLEWSRFQSVVGALLERAAPRQKGVPCRVFGEMVGLLWTAGQHAAAIALESFWNKLLSMGDFQLYCAYPIDIFDAEFHTPEVQAILKAHNHFIPSGQDGAVRASVNRAAGDTLNGWGRSRSAAPRGLRLPEGEAKILWLREHAPAEAEEILSLARHHYGSEKRFRALIENSSDAIALTDLRGRISYASQSTSRVLGYKPAYLIGKNGIGFIHPADRVRARDAVRRMLDSPREPVPIEIRVRNVEGGWRWIEATGSNFFDDPDISALVFNYRDITSRKNAETALREREAALERANRALEQFGFAAAHDLQEPIRNVAIYAELLDRRYGGKLEPAAKIFLEVVREGAARMQALTCDLLSFTQATGEPAAAEDIPWADGNDAMAEVVASLRDLISGSAAEVTWADLPRLRICQAHLVQVLQKLVANGLKYRSAANPRVHVSATPDAENQWLIRVADNGAGIPAEYREHVFGVFKRLHGREIPGNGIGLAICRRIVAHYGGRIWVDPRPDGGSILTFSLPRGDTHDSGAGK